MELHSTTVHVPPKTSSEPVAATSSGRHLEWPPSCPRCSTSSFLRKESSGVALNRCRCPVFIHPGQALGHGAAAVTGHRFRVVELPDGAGRATRASSGKASSDAGRRSPSEPAESSGTGGSGGLAGACQARARQLWPCWARGGRGRVGSGQARASARAAGHGTAAPARLGASGGKGGRTGAANRWGEGG
jgi:hypothetical protein